MWKSGVLRLVDNLGYQKLMKNFAKKTCATRVSNPANINLFKVNHRDSTRKCETHSKLTKRHQNMVKDLALMSLLSTLNIFHILL